MLFSTKPLKIVNIMIATLVPLLIKLKRNQKTPVNTQINNVRVTINKFNIIVLDGYVDGVRHRLSTKTKKSLWRVLWYTLNSDMEFNKRYKASLISNVLKKNNTFRVYGLNIILSTQNYRNSFSQKDQLAKFYKLCETFGNMKMNKIKVSHILQWQNNINLAPKTIINYRSTLNIILKYAVYDELLHSNPLTIVRAPRSIEKDVDIFSLKELQLLLKEVDGQLYNIILFVAFTGVRAGELIGLKWSDIDFKKGTISILRRVREGIEDVPKSKKKGYWICFHKLD